MSFEDFSKQFAEQCKICGKKGHNRLGNKIVVCQCQLRAIIKYRCETLPVSLKDLEWIDYTGSSPVNGNVVDIANWQQGRDISLAYCFSDKSVSHLSGCSYSMAEVKDFIKHRISNSKIINRLKEGANLVLLGEDSTGKTLLASLIAKEVIYASVLLMNMNVKWTSFNTLINAMNFDRMDFSLLEDLIITDFLFLDNVYRPHQGDYRKNAIDELFHERLNNKKPTIITGTRPIGDSYSNNRQALGDEFYRMLNSSYTAKIVLETS